MSFLDIANTAPAPVQVGMETVYVKCLTLAERNKLLMSNMDNPDDKQKFDAKIVIATLCDEAGKLLLTDNDLDVVCAKDGWMVSKVAMAALAHNHIGNEQDLKKS
jgi:hypothetical protein